MAAQGHDFTAVANALDMDTNPKGALSMALRRAGHLDLLRVLNAPHKVSVTHVLELAERILDTLPVEDDVTVQRRRHDLLTEINDDGPIEPSGHPVRGPGGIVRWVAA